MHRRANDLQMHAGDVPALFRSLSICSIIFQKANGQAMAAATAHFMRRHSRLIATV